jgi:predicted nucleotidyltransferase component of viral defense system
MHAFVGSKRSYDRTSRRFSDASVSVNVAASVHQRLLNKARETKRPFNELLQYFAMERFLYRLSESPYAERFVMKGALMFVVWHAPVSRPTMDIDLLGITDNDVDAIVHMVKEICPQDVEADGLVFDPDSVKGQRIAEDANYEGVRVRFRGKLGTARISMQLDIGFGDVVIPPLQVTEYPTLLALPAPRLRAYSRESAVAEKFEAMVKLDVLNSRMKDFYDVWLLARQFDFDGPTLAEAIAKTFSRRGTPIPTDAAALMQKVGAYAGKEAQWQGFIRRNRLQDIPGDFSVIVGAIVIFLAPISKALAANSPFKGIWKAPGPWAESELDAFDGLTS